MLAQFGLNFAAVSMLGVTGVLAVTVFLVSFIFFIYKIAKDSYTHTNGFIKTVLKIFLVIFDLLFAGQVAFFVMEMVNQVDIIAFMNTVTFDMVESLYISMVAITVITLALVFYRNTNSKIYVTPKYRIDGRRINEKAIKREAKEAKKAEKKAAKEAKKAAKKAQAEKDAKADEPVERGFKNEKVVQTEPVAEAPVVESPAVEEKVELPKVVAHRKSR